MLTFLRSKGELLVDVPPFRYEPFLFQHVHCMCCKKLSKDNWRTMCCCRRTTLCMSRCGLRLVAERWSFSIDEFRCFLHLAAFSHVDSCCCRVGPNRRHDEVVALVFIFL